MLPITLVIGYARVSKVDQRPGLQLDALREVGCERVNNDKVTGDSEARYQLRLALKALGEGDVFVVWALDRLTRNLSQLIRLGAELKERGIELRSLKEGIDTTTPAGRFAFHIRGAMAKFERYGNSERGNAAAMAVNRRGRRRDTPSMFHDPQRIDLPKSLLRDGSLSKRAVARQVGGHFNTLHKWFPSADKDRFRHSYANEIRGGETEAKAA